MKKYLHAWAFCEIGCAVNEPHIGQNEELSERFRGKGINDSERKQMREIE